MRLVVGLGNPGGEYRLSRHNAGFMVLDALGGALPEIKAYRALLREWRFSGRRIFLLKPQTFMNLSGEAVAPFMARHEIGVCEMMLVYDDVDIPFGRIRICQGGGTAGHNGVESVVQAVGGSGFARLRIGIGGAQDAARRRDFVLDQFDPCEMDELKLVVAMSVEALKLALSRGTAKAMNDFNGIDAKTFAEKGLGKKSSAEPESGKKNPESGSGDILGK